MRRFWGWELATYLFLGGLGGGMLTFAAVLDLIIAPNILTSALITWGCLVAFICLAGGCGLLVFELGQPPVFLRAFVAKKAVIKWGAVLLSVALIFDFIFLVWQVGWFENWPLLHFVIPSDWFGKFCLAIAGLAGAAVMVYTGVLLSSLKARPFWNTPVLPVLFTVSALSTGACLLALCLGNFPFPADWMGSEGYAYMGTILWEAQKEELIEFLHHSDAVLVICEILVLGLFVLLQFCAGDVYAKRVADKWVRGSWAFYFWGLMVGCGLVIPFIFNLMGGVLGSVVSPIMVLLAGWFLRFLILWSCDRRLDEGEEKYYTRIANKDYDIVNYWDAGREYFTIVNKDEFNDIPERVPREKTGAGKKFKMGIGMKSVRGEQPNPLPPRGVPVFKEPSEAASKVLGAVIKGA